jgi:hypothetical protein
MNTTQEMNAGRWMNMRKKLLSVELHRSFSLVENALKLCLLRTNSRLVTCFDGACGQTVKNKHMGFFQPPILHSQNRHEIFSSSKCPKRLWDSSCCLPHTYRMFFPEGKSAGASCLITHLHLTQRLRMSRAISLLPHTPPSMTRNNIFKCYCFV